MKTSDVAKAVGEKTYTIRDLIEHGKIKAHKVPDPAGRHESLYEVDSTLDEVREALIGRVRRPRKNSTEANKRLAMKPLPANKDLFITEEVAKLAGISRSSVYNFIKEKGITPLRNGRNQYVPRAVVEQIREKYAAKPEPVVVAPKVHVAASDVELKRLQSMMMELTNAWSRTDLFVRRFAKSCGYTEE